MRAIFVLGTGLVACGVSAAPVTTPSSPPVAPPSFVVETPIDARCPRGFVSDLSQNCVPHEPLASQGMAWIPASDGFFWMDVTEVTASAYNACVAAKKCAPAAIEDDEEWISHEARMRTRGGCTGANAARGAHPINCITLTDARAYCAWIEKRLPTAEEWERAASGPTPRRFPWGEFVPGPSDVCWTPGKNRNYEDGPCLAGSHPVDTSPYGVEDLGGSLAEYVEADFFVPKSTRRREVPIPGMRGGTWLENPYDSSVGNLEITRFRGEGVSPNEHSWFIGFRCAK